MHRPEYLSPVPTPPWYSVTVVDPGVWTGWVWMGFSVLDLIDFRDHELIRACMTATIPMCIAGQLDCSDENAGVDALANFVIKGRERTEVNAGRVQSGAPVLSVVIAEDFVLRQRTMDRSLLSPVRINAKLDYVFHESDIEFYDDQSSSDAKSTVSDERLKRWDLFERGRPHRNDAIRHLILWLRKLRNDLAD